MNKEWSTVDKSAWGDGPWQQEPDKKQWRDEATGLPCLIVRGPSGSLCGYVGIAPDHPLHGKGYDDVDLEAHGGLTFADGCAEITPERWERARQRYADSLAEAERHPNGDAAEFRRKMEPLLCDFPAWVERTQASSICHLPDPGEPDRVWWFGFDCAHSGDYSPKYANQFRDAFRSYEDVYRDLAYVEQQCAGLAKQLAAAR